MNLNGAISIYDEQKFKVVSYIFMLLVCFSFLVPYNNPYFKFTQDLLILIYFIFSLLSTSHNFILIGLIFITLYFNTSSIYHTIIPTIEFSLSKKTLSFLRLFLSLLGFVFLVVGMWQNHKGTQLSRLTKKTLVYALLFVVVFSLVFQFTLFRR